MTPRWRRRRSRRRRSPWVIWERSSNAAVSAGSAMRRMASGDGVAVHPVVRGDDLTERQIQLGRGG
jgi:hypothetical protein